MAYERTPRGNILDTDTGRIITKAQLMSEGWEGAYVPLYYAKPIMDTLGQENVDKILALPGWDMNRLVATLNVAAQVYGDDSQAIKDAPFGAEIPVALQKERLAKGLNLTQDQLSEVGQRWEREQLQFELHAKMDLSDVQREDLNPRPPETIRNDFNDVSTVVETVMDIKER